MAEVIAALMDFLTGGAVALGAWAFGGLDGFVKVLIAFAVLDQVTGVAAGYVTHELSSDAGFKGIAKKMVIFGLVGVAHLMDEYVLPGNQELMRTAVCMFYIGNEGISIVENADKLGVPFPEYIREHFSKLKTRETRESESE